MRFTILLAAFTLAAASSQSQSNDTTQKLAGFPESFQGDWDFGHSICGYNTPNMRITATTIENSFGEASHPTFFLSNAKNEVLVGPIVKLKQVRYAVSDNGTTLKEWMDSGRPTEYIRCTRSPSPVRPADGVYTGKPSTDPNFARLIANSTGKLLDLDLTLTNKDDVPEMNRGGSVEFWSKKVAKIGNEFVIICPDGGDLTNCRGMVTWNQKQHRVRGRFLVLGARSVDWYSDGPRTIYDLAPVVVK